MEAEAGKQSKSWFHSPRFSELELMERFPWITPEKWEEMEQTEEGRYHKAELMQFVAEKGMMSAWEYHDRRKEWDSR